MNNTLRKSKCKLFAGCMQITCMQDITKHRWFSGRMLACHAGGPGSIPGRCIFFLLFFASKQMQHEYHYDLFLLSPMQRKQTYFEYNNSREGQCVANFLSPTDLPSIQSQITDQWEPRVGAGDVVTCAVFSLARLGSPDMTAVQASICRITQHSSFSPGWF